MWLRGLDLRVAKFWIFSKVYFKQLWLFEHHYLCILHTFYIYLN